MELKIVKIKVDPKKRIRKTSGQDLSELKTSLQKVGLIHPITINEKYELIAGYRRFMAALELGWETIEVIMKQNITELEELDIEIEENWRRKDLTPYELDIALARRKKLYEKLHPETSHGGYMKTVRKPGQMVLPKKSIVAESAGIEHSKLPIKQQLKQKETFSQSTAEIIGISDRSIRDKVRVGQGILNKEYDENTITLYKQGVITHSNMLQKIKRKKSIIDKKEPPDPNPLLNLRYCKECSKSRASTCPFCSKQILICDKGYIILKKPDSEACEDFEN